MTVSPEQNHAAVRRMPALKLDDYALSVESSMAAEWSFNNRLYEIWAIYDDWPDGMLCNIAGPTVDGVVIQAIWRDTEAQDKYFGEVAIHRFSEVVDVINRESDEKPQIPDLEPVHRVLTHLTLGPLAGHFVDIGADLDATASRQLGTVLTALDIVLPGLSREQVDLLWQRLRLVDAVEPELILRMQEQNEDGEIFETHVWSSEDAARRFVEHELLPALAELDTAEPVTPDLTYREVKRLAIEGSELGPDRIEQLR